MSMNYALCVAGRVIQRFYMLLALEKVSYSNNKGKVMFNKLKASLGIGAAKVDTVLQSMNVAQGEMLKGVVHIQGGDVAQDIDAIKLKLCTEMKVEVDDSTSHETFVLGQLEAVQPFTIQPGENKQVPFEFKLHDETPITVLNAKMNQSYVWVETTLDIDFAIDPKDRDMVNVEHFPSRKKLYKP